MTSEEVDRGTPGSQPHIGNQWSGRPTPEPHTWRTADQIVRLLSEAGVEPTRVTPSVIGGVGVLCKRGPRAAYVEVYNTGDTYAMLSDRETEEVQIRQVNGWSEGRFTRWVCNHFSNGDSAA